MKCEAVKDNVRAIISVSMTDADMAENMAHIETCPDCRAALRGAEALAELRRRETVAPADHLFNQVLKASTLGTDRETSRRRFWYGAGFGGAVAASFFAMALIFGWADDLRPKSPVTAEFVVALDQPRQMNLAFETNRQLAGATISIVLSGDVEIDGYGVQRELSWSADLDAGVNRLSLPVLANGINGGKMVVRLSHPQSEQLFVIDLLAET